MTQGDLKSSVLLSRLCGGAARNLCNDAVALFDQATCEGVAFGAFGINPKRFSLLLGKTTSRRCPGDPRRYHLSGTIASLWRGVHGTCFETNENSKASYLSIWDC